jgi:hypothetical protein
LLLCPCARGFGVKLPVDAFGVVLGDDAGGDECG